MMFLDIIVGYFIPELFGWLFFVFVILIETLVFRKLLRKPKTSVITILVALANLTTTLFGYGMGELINLDYQKHIGHVINIIPIDYYKGKYMLSRAAFVYILSFFGTMILETYIFYLGLKKYHIKKRHIIKTSLIVNLTSYFIGLLVIYFYVVFLMFDH